MAPARRERSPRRRLFRLALALSLATGAVVLAGTLLRHAAAEVLSSTKQHLLDQELLASRQTALAVEGSVARLLREMEHLAEQPAVRQIEPEGARRAMERALSHVRSLEVNDISRTDAAGIVRITLNSPELLGQDFSFRDYFARVRTQPPGTPVYEFLTFRGFRKGQKGVLVAMPVFDERERFAGPLVFILEVGKLLQGALPAPEPGRRSWVVDGEGTVLYHDRFPSGTPLAEAGGSGAGWERFLAGIRGNHEVRGEYRDARGRMVLAVATQVRIAGAVWSVVTEADAATAQLSLMHFNREQAAAGLVAILAIAGIAAFLVLESRRGNAALRAEVVERRRVERELRGSEHSYRTLVENSPS